MKADLGKMNILIIHHAESGFNDMFDEFRYLIKLVKHLKDNEYNLVVLNVSEIGYDTYFEYQPNLETAIEELCHVFDIQFFKEYISWGYELSSLDEGERDDVIVFNEPQHSEYWPIPGWLNAVQDASQVDICGMFRYECFRDLEEFLDTVNIEYNIIEELVE